MFPLEKKSIQVLCPFFNQIVYVFIIELYKFVVYFEILTPY